MQDLKSLNKKPKRNIFTILFSKYTLYVLIIVIQFVCVIGIAFTIALMSEILVWVSWAYIFATALSVVVLLFIIVNNKMDIQYRLSWLLLVAIFPILGLLCFFLFGNKKFSKKEKNEWKPTKLALDNTLNDPSSNGISDELTPDDGDVYSFATYLRRKSHTDMYKNTKVTYFNWGEEALPVMVEKLKTAKHYIFMEYFIIEPGKMWGEILEVLLEKVKEGVDVRLMYDDFGCLKTLPKSYDKKLREAGIKCFKVSRIKPFLDIRMNNRDHRKIMVIDGHTGFTGGINLADEYINHVVRFGKWKDNAIMVEGDAVFGLTTIFLSTWTKVAKEKDVIKFTNYLPSQYKDEIPPLKDTSGYVQPYQSLPYTYETVGLNVYSMLLSKAKYEVCITSPYLILSDALRDQMCLATKSGVKIKLLVPHIPDKKLVFQLARANYRKLLKEGVEIYEYTPGFVHEKVFIVDDIMATVGTINLDYRSLFLHMENGTYLYKCKCIKDIKKDFESTLKVSMRVDYKEYMKTKWYVKVLWFFLKIFAPLL